MDIYLTKVGRHIVQKYNVELASRLSHGILKINMAILVDYQSTMMLKKYTYIYIYRLMWESLRDLEVVRGGRKSSSNLTYFNQAKLANADVVNKFKWHNKISENAGYTFQNVRQCIITGFLRFIVFQSCRVMQIPDRQSGEDSWHRI